MKKTMKKSRILSVLLCIVLLIVPLSMEFSTNAAYGEDVGFIAGPNTREWESAVSDGTAIVNLKTDYMTNPLGIDYVNNNEINADSKEKPTPGFSWEMASNMVGQRQTAYQILVATDKNFKNIAWDSMTVKSDKQAGVHYDGAPLQSGTRYFWKVKAADQNGVWYESETAWFETGLMSNDQTNWADGIQWIGNPKSRVDNANTNGNTWNAYYVTAYTLSFNFSLADVVAMGSKKFSVIYSARSKLTYMEATVDLFGTPTLTITEWFDGVPTVRRTTDLTSVIPDTPEGKAGTYVFRMQQTSATASTVYITALGGTPSVSGAATHSGAVSNMPTRWGMDLFGFKVPDTRLTIDSFRIYNGSAATPGTSNQIYYSDNFTDPHSMMGDLGTVSDGKLTMTNVDILRASIPAVTLRKEFEVNPAKEIASARLYSAARGIYDISLNGQPVTDTFLNPNSTEWRLRIMYQTFDVTDLLRSGANAIGAYVGRGWYCDVNGYSGAQNTGTNGDMLAFIRVCYTDGTTEDIVKTDSTWSYTDKGPILHGSYLHGEWYDASMEMPGWDKAGFTELGWQSCGVKNPPNYTTPVSLANNGTSRYYTTVGRKYQLTAQVGPLAQVERVASAVDLENPHVNYPEGHEQADSNFRNGVYAYTYDLAQNLSGVPKITVKGAPGTQIVITGSEINYNNGTPYPPSYRTAYCTNSYTLKGDPNGETYIPRFTFNGFRYVVVRVVGDTTGNMVGPKGSGKPVEVWGVDALSLTNTEIITGGFDSSDDLLAQLQNNIEWGQRGNYLMVPTDCPQRNERCGWTGDAQVFATTAAYNADVVAFMRKWLVDLRDAQLAWNQLGAVPDYAPLAGDTGRTPTSCSGWGDAAVIVPWYLYLATGDEQILRDNWDLMYDQICYRGGVGAPGTGSTAAALVNITLDNADSDFKAPAGANNEYVDAVAAANEVSRAGLLDKSKFAGKTMWLVCRQRRGDHLSLDASTPWALSGTAYAAHINDLFVKICDILGDKPVERAEAATYYENYKNGFNAMYVLDNGAIHYYGERDTGAYTANHWHSKWGLGTGTQTPAGGTKGATTVDFYGNYVSYTHYAEPEYELPIVTLPNSPGRLDALGYAPPSQTSYALAIDFGLLTPEQEKVAGDFMARDIKLYREGCLNAGFLGVAHVAPALSKTGHDKDAYDLLMNDTFPGWMFTIKQGATTFWERWNSYQKDPEEFGPSNMNSFNHYAYGSIGFWMYTRIAGININEAKPGYKHVDLTPVAGADLTYAKSYHDSSYGRVESGWKANDNLIYQYNCTIPGNTTATLYLPVKADGVKVSSSGVEYVGNEIRNGQNCTVFNIAAGGYNFTIENGVVTVNTAEGYVDTTFTFANPSVTEYEANTPFDVIVTALGDASKVKIVNELGNTVGKLGEVITKNADGTKSYRITVMIGTPGDKRTLSAMVMGQIGDYKAVGATLDVKIIPASPTQNEQDIISAVAEVSECGVNTPFNVTVVTSKDITKIKIVGETGSSIGTLSSSVVTSGNTKTWTISIKVGSKGNRTLTALGAASTGGYGEKGKSFNIAIK